MQCKRITDNIIQIDDLLTKDQVELLHVNYNEFTYGWKASGNNDYDQGHWNNLIIGFRNNKSETEDLQEDSVFKDSSIYPIWNKLKMLTGERELLRCYFNSYTYGTDGYLNKDVNKNNITEDKLNETILVYCNKEWAPDWAGETLFFNTDKTEIIHATLPKRNRILVFDASIPHVGRSPSRACFSQRKILAFKTRKYIINEQDCVKHITDNFSHIKHSGTTFAGHLLGTYTILKQLDLPIDVCVAGLFHAVYGTEYFKHESIESREKVRKLIGDYSEDLVYTFCTTKNRFETIKNKESFNPVKRYHLACIEYANLTEQSGRIKINNAEEMLNIIKGLGEV